MSASFGDNGRNGGKKQLSPNMILLLVGIFVILPMSGLFGLLWTAVAAVLLVKQAKKEGADGDKRSAPLSPRRTESKRPRPVRIQSHQAHLSERHQTRPPQAGAA